MKLTIKLQNFYVAILGKLNLLKICEITFIKSSILGYLIYQIKVHSKSSSVLSGKYGPFPKITKPISCLKI